MGCDVRAVCVCLALVGGLVRAAAGQDAPESGPPVPEQAPAAMKLPTITQVSPKLNLGVHLPLAFASDTVTFVNSGNEPIVLERAQGECSCTDATILQNTKPFGPGEQIEVLVGVEYPREAGLYTKTFYVYEKGNPAPYPVQFDFEVGYAIKINGGPKYAIVVERGGRLTLESRTRQPFRVISISGMAPVFEGFDPATDPLRDNYSLMYSLNDVRKEDLPRWLVIETDHPDAEMMAIPARISGWRPILDKTAWHPMDEFITMGTISGQGPTRTSMLFSGKPVLPGKRIVVKSSNPELSVRVIGARRPDRGGGMVVDFDIAPMRDVKGFVSSVLTVEYDDAETGFDVFARVDPSMPAPPVPNR